MEDFSRYTYSYSVKHPNEQRQIVKEHLIRIKQGKEVWNDWSEKFQKHIKLNNVQDPYIDMSSVSFDADISFHCLNFIGDINFSNASFNGFANFNKANFYGHTNFSQAKFYGKSCFDNTLFEDDVAFSEAIFNKVVTFKSAKFMCHASFNSIKFMDEVSFWKAQFNNLVGFNHSTFNVDASFYETIFKNDVTFLDSTFDHADFSIAKFYKNSDFINSVFKKTIFLKHSKFYSTVPDFNCTSFKQAPSLDSVKIPFIKHPYIGRIEEYRKLKSMAKSSNDHENELLFFGYETRAKAYLKRTPLLQKIFIKCYYWFSNFGTSFVRPWVSIVTFLFFIFIANQILIEPDSPQCIEQPSAYQHNLFSYTLSQSLPLVTLEKNQRETMDRCLFGTGGKKTKTLKHSLWRIVHFVPTTLFLFLFGLAVRNRFKIS